jgi:hypothetical protein
MLTPPTADTPRKRDRRPSGVLAVVLPAFVYLWIAVHTNRPLHAQGSARLASVAQTEVRRLPPLDSSPLGGDARPYGQLAEYRRDTTLGLEGGDSLLWDDAAGPATASSGPTAQETVQPFGAHAPALPSDLPSDFTPQGDAPSGPAPHQRGPCEPGWHPIDNHCGGMDWYRLDGVVRSYYANDQRIEWTGIEATFGVEGAIAPVYRHRFGNWDMTLLGEFYLNQPFNRNLLLDRKERRSYAANYDVDTVEISQLLLGFRREDLEFRVGKMETPFGRTYFPLYSNSRFDAPFIRTEAIRWRETGILVRYDPNWLVCDVAVTNGCDDRDTNSSKALVSRIGIEQERWAGGISLKIQDGIGSEGQKEYNNHVGADLMYRWGIFTLSAEAIYDQYGFRKTTFDPDNIFWGRSIYYRDLNKAREEPITGVGYYFNLGFTNGRWTGVLNYGEYYPESIGNPKHDVINRRAIVKLDYDLAKRLEAYAVVILETSGYMAQCNRPRRGTAILTGVQYTF